VTKKYKFTGVVKTMGVIIGPKKSNGTNNYIAIDKFFFRDDIERLNNKTITVEVIFKGIGVPVCDRKTNQWNEYIDIKSLEIIGIN